MVPKHDIKLKNKTLLKAQWRKMHLKNAVFIGQCKHHTEDAFYVYQLIHSGSTSKFICMGSLIISIQKCQQLKTHF